jgi:transcriptional/translational regulatory protein YebC/TACO1
VYLSLALALLLTITTCHGSTTTLLLLPGAIADALKEGVPKVGIEKALKSGSSGETDNAFELEVMGPGGCALIVKTTVDRKFGQMCKEIADIRKLVVKKGGRNASEVRRPLFADISAFLVVLALLKV